VRYVCRELQAELDQRGDGLAIAQLQQQIHATFERLIAMRAERLEAQCFVELEASLRRRSPRRTAA
jgi:hypothetical protein